MANLNKFLGIGRLGKDPESRTFTNGGKVTNFSFCVSNKKKGNDGKWIDDPVWLDCAAYNRGEHGKTADLCEQYLHKGDLAYIEGHLVMDSWTDKETGDKRQKLKVVVDKVEFLQTKKHDSEPSKRTAEYQPGEDDFSPPPPPPAAGEIPF